MPDRPSSKIWSRACLGAGLAALIAVHAPVLGYKKFADVDEGYCAAIAARLLDGAKLYRDAVSQRGPLMYYGFEGMARLTGWDNVLGWRCWALAFALAHVLLVYWAGKTLLSRNAGVVAALATVYALAFGLPPRDSLALHGETMQLPPLIVAVVLGALAMRYAAGTRERTLRILGSGVCIGVAICIKQSVALHPLPLLVWLFVSARRNRGPMASFVRDAAVLVVGCILPPLVFVAHAALEGTLRDLVYYTYTYNVTTHMHPTKRTSIWIGALFERLLSGTLFFTLLALLAGTSIPFLARRVRSAWRERSVQPVARAFGVRSYLALHLLMALAAGAAMSRFFPHYFIESLPFMTLLLGAVVDGWFHARPAVARSVVAALAAFFVGHAALSAYFGEKIDGRVAHDGLVERLSKYIETTTAPTDKIFVWGFSPWIYEYSHRRPAGRYVFVTYVTGFVPWFWEDPAIERARIVPGSTEALLGDLDREKPEIVVDAGSVLIGRPMRAYEKPDAWLHEHYCFSFRFGAYDVYRRRHEGARCAVDYFPRVHPPVDFYGHDAPYAVMPLPLDNAESHWLPPSEFDSPVWFDEEPEPPGLDALRDLRLEADRRTWLKKIGVKDAKDLLPPPPCPTADAGAGRP